VVPACGRGLTETGDGVVGVLIVAAYGALALLALVCCLPLLRRGAGEDRAAGRDEP
jgi:hypothetical protein